MRNATTKRRVIFGYLVLAGASTAWCQDWPTFGHDSHRNAASDANVELPLGLAWIHSADNAPAPAWPPPAKHDYWHHKKDLHPRVTFDHAYHTAVRDGRVYYGSSTNDSVVSLDIQNGARVWSFYTEGPVRLSPTLDGEQLYVGSDDGNVYCLAPATGKLIWKRRIGPSGDKCIGNGRMISRWPVRSGIAVYDNIVYCAAGLFPTSEGVYLAGLDRNTGAPIMQRSIDQSVQGYLAVTDDQIILSSGRTAPQAYRRADGKPIGEISSDGGTYTVVSEQLVVSGQGDGDGRLALTRPDTREHLLSLQGLHLIAHRDHLYVQSRKELAALDRAKFLPLAYRHAELTQKYEAAKKRKDASAQDEAAQLKQELAAINEGMQACWQWKIPCDNIESLILAGSTLFAGGHQSIVAVDTETGREVWRGTVKGRACGLAATPQRLLVSTDRGDIYCFASNTEDIVTEQEAERHDSAVRDNSEARLSEELAESILTSLPTDKGFGLVVGNRAAPLATALAEQSQLRLILVQRDQDAIDASRVMLRQRGLLGNRVVVHQANNSALPYPPLFANLMVLPGAGVETEIKRLLRPEGGVAWLHSKAGAASAVDALPDDSFAIERPAQLPDKWTLVRRHRLPGSGQWTHGLADPGNTGCSQDQLVDGPVRIQWFGRPGPRSMADRHHRAVAPLYSSGRMFVPGENLVITVDAYNGTELWRREIPKSLRLGAFLDCSNMVVDDQTLFLVAEDTCHKMNVSDGAPRQSQRMPQLIDEQHHHWGYVARVNDLLLGSGRKPDSSYYRQSREADLALWYDNMSLVTSSYLFGLPAEGGPPTWTYQSGIIINSTITIGGERLYFLESHAEKALKNESGRMPMSAFLGGDCFLVALDLKTGTQLWKQPYDLSNCQHIVYLNYAQEKLIVSGNRYVNRKLWYFFEGLDAASGDAVWQASADSDYNHGGDHGEQNRHPTIVGNTVYTYPHAYDLHNGRQLPDWKFDRIGHGCGNISASAGSIFWRGGNPWQRELATGGKPMRINSVNRPGCFINIIPAGGMLLIPEASSGCTCGFPLQTSLAYIPEKLIAAIVADRSAIRTD